MKKILHQNCKECNNRFIAKNTRAIYCSDLCRVRAHRKKNVTVTQKQDYFPLAEEIRLQEITAKIEKEEKEIENLDNRIAQTKNKLAKIEYTLLMLKRHLKGLEYIEKFLKEINGGSIEGKHYDDILKLLKELGNKNKYQRYLIEITAVQLKEGKRVFYNFTKEIKEVENQIQESEKKAKELESRLMRMKIFTLYLQEIDAKSKRESVEKLKTEFKELEKTILQLKNVRELSQLRDDEGFVKAKDVKNIDFSERFSLGGDMGQFLGALDRNRCAITLSGRQGSGKTYFSYDLISRFLEYKLKVACFSLEEGISQLTKEKLSAYRLQNEENLKIKDEGDLEAVRLAAKNFDVIIIDSWGKLKVHSEEFDKLRLAFSQTIFVVIFQQTTGGKIRGGTMPAYDAAINIETFLENNRRIAICTKNRYGRTGVKYLIDERKTYTD